MEFIKNNLTILITASLAIASGIFNVYQYFENKKLKKYTTEKDLKRRKASLEKLHNDYNNYKNNTLNLTGFGEGEKKENEFKYREKCIIAEIEYLEKILKIKSNG